MLELTAEQIRVVEAETNPGLLNPKTQEEFVLVRREFFERMQKFLAPFQKGWDDPALDIYEQYRKAPEVTRKRMYLETMSQVLAHANKVIVDDAAKGVVPYFQLPNMGRAPAAAPDQNTPRPPSASGTIVQAPPAEQGGQGTQP